MSLLFSRSIGLAFSIVLFIYTASFSNVKATEAEVSLGLVSDTSKWNYEHFFKAGTEAYLDNYWELCVKNLEKALAVYKQDRAILAQCRLSCHNDTSVVDEEGPFKPITTQNRWDHRNKVSLTVFYEFVVRNALCLMQCEKEIFAERPQVTNLEVEQDFSNKVPYDYLQLCYFKLGKHQNAASSAYTFLVHNPEHAIMQNNLMYYLDLPDVAFNNVKYLDAKKYQELYFQGTRAYSLEDFPRVIEAMELALDSYFKAEAECRALCEGGLPTSPQTSFIIAIAHHYTFTLRCKIKCPYQLSLGHGDVKNDLLPSFFHYLQFAYYKTGAVEKSCQAVASFLALRSNDSVMLENELFYQSLDTVEPHWLTPREDVLKYIERYEEDHRFLDYVDQAFNFTADKSNYKYQNRGLVPVVGSQAEQPLVSRSTGSSTSTQEALLEARKAREAWASNNGIKLLLAEEALKGKQRFVADGLASLDDCQKLVHLASEGATHGDGYNGKLSPHTEFEAFEGLTVARAVTLVNKGAVDPLEAQLFLNASEKARHYVEGYFNLTTKLYFAFTHLVCRTTLPESPKGRVDLSHPIHADNCLLTKDGECLKQRPAYTWRDYSAILYLNDNFEGGEFFFAKNKKDVEATVEPICGRMVAFSAGKENLHGVQAVISGRRCALAMWYTLDPRYQERERTIAEQAISELAANRLKLKQQLPSPPAALCKMHKKGNASKMSNVEEALEDCPVSPVAAIEPPEPPEQPPAQEKTKQKQRPNLEL